MTGIPVIIKARLKAILYLLLYLLYKLCIVAIIFVINTVTVNIYCSGKKNGNTTGLQD